MTIRSSILARKSFGFATPFMLTGIHISFICFVPSPYHFIFLYSDATVVMNCTFSRYVWGLQLPDFTFCMFMQTMFGMDSFNWQLGSADTSTPNTGPSEDHSGTGIGESNVPTMQYLNGIPRNTAMKTYMLSLD